MLTPSVFSCSVTLGMKWLGAPHSGTGSVAQRSQAPLNMHRSKKGLDQDPRHLHPVLKLMVGARKALGMAATEASCLSSSHRLPGRILQHG